MLTGVINSTQEGTNAGTGFQDISPQSEKFELEGIPRA